MNKKGFTLAEILITLSIIGVVAAITLPTLIQTYKRHIVETRLKDFYSNINQAILMAESEYGDKKDWAPTSTEEFWNTYLKNYLKYIKVEDKINSGTYQKYVYFSNGSAVIIYIWRGGPVTNGGGFEFFPNGKDAIEYYTYRNKIGGIERFTFAYWPNETNSSFKYHKGYGVEPYKAWWDGKDKSLYTNSQYGCNTKSSSSHMYCAAVIQKNGWKIPKDYPFKF